ncbi:MAG: hypothetical protein ACYDCL_09055 [Myxococcales bacterium]
MVNKNISSPSSGPIAGAGSSTTGSGTAGGGIASIGAPPAGTLPPATAKVRSGFRKELTTLVSGLQTGLPSPATDVLVSGQQTPASSLISAIQALLALYGAVDANVQTLKSSRLALQAALPGGRQLVTAIKAGLVALFGKGNPALEAFGFSGKKPRQLTVEEKTASKAKRKATRELRNTQGSRQKARVKFTGSVDVQANLAEAPAGGSTPAAGGNTGAGSTAGGNTGAGSTAGGNTGNGSSSS